MDESRIFPDENAPTKAADYHGGGRCVRIEPELAADGIESLNLELSLDEAVKLSLAIQSCVLSINRYHRGTIAGREMGMLLSIKTAAPAISVIEKRVSPE